ncbi:MAG: lipopolysaccharide biosynthesis protein RfbH [Elusimicrobiota bacterium]
MTKEYYKALEAETKREFIKRKSRVNYAGRVFDDKELVNLVDSSLEFWLTYGRYSKEFETKLAEFLGIKYCLLVNSGSSANLIAFMALTSHLLDERRVNRGDEVITIACGFPTTIAPIIQYGAVPVFVDVDVNGNIDPKHLESALSKKTKAVMAAHTLGNPFDIREVKAFCSKHNLWLIEDNCDALGSKYDGRYTGTWGDIGTSSFYPPHHMTMGEGGAVYTNDPMLKKIMLSMRDWGRDCWCESGVDNTCKNRFSGQFGKLPFGYDHKYVYSHFGFNLKTTDMQAAIGCAQIDKLEGFIKKRRENHEKIYDGLKDLKKYFILPEPAKNAEPSWFGFLITLQDNLSFTRNDVVEYLEKHNIQTRNLFGGNLVKQPVFDDLIEGKDYRIAGGLKNTDKIMYDSFWFGVYPGMKEEALDYIIEVLKEFVK